MERSRRPFTKKEISFMRKLVSNYNIHFLKDPEVKQFLKDNNRAAQTVYMWVRRARKAKSLKNLRKSYVNKTAKNPSLKSEIPSYEVSLPVKGYELRNDNGNLSLIVKF